MQADEEDEEDAAPEEFVALCGFSGSSSEQVGESAALSGTELGISALTFDSVCLTA